MESATLSDLVRCQIGVGPEPGRVGLVLDYRGDRPPLELLDMLRRYGWLTPAPHAPPARAIDWDHPDVEAGRRWSLRPFLVLGALAVPGPAAAEWSASRAWLEQALEANGLALTGEPVEVGPLREARQGLVEMVFEHAGAPVDPFEPPEGRNLVPLGEARPGPSPVPSPATDAAPAAPSDVTAPGGEPGGAPLLWTAADPVLHQRTVSAVVRRGVVGRLVELLEEMELEDGAVMLPVAGCGRGGGRVTRYRGRESVEMLQRIQLQVPVDPGLVERVVARIAEVARVGEKGDGKIWVT